LAPVTTLMSLPEKERTNRINIVTYHIIYIPPETL
jgi:hypothetical protein